MEGRQMRSRPIEKGNEGEGGKSDPGAFPGVLFKGGKEPLDIPFQ
jgi:hypothetical protein